MVRVYPGTVLLARAQSGRDGGHRLVQWDLTLFTGGHILQADGVLGQITVTEDQGEFGTGLIRGLQRPLDASTAVGQIDPNARRPQLCREHDQPLLGRIAE